MPGIGHRSHGAAAILSRGLDLTAITLADGISASAPLLPIPGYFRLVYQPVGDWKIIVLRAHFHSSY
jgi:hypothetical protein